MAAVRKRVLAQSSSQTKGKEKKRLPRKQRACELQDNPIRQALAALSFDRSDEKSAPQAYSLTHVEPRKPVPTKKDKPNRETSVCRPLQSRGLQVMQCLSLSGSSDTRKLQESFVPISGVELALHHCSDLVEVRHRLAAEFPYAIEIIDKLLSPSLRRESVSGRGTVIQPTLLYGAPGLGKSRLARRMCEELGVPHKVVSASGMVDDHIFGVSRGFTSGHPSVVLEAMRDGKVPNPVIIIDEIDKVVTDSRNGNIVNKLLPLLEKAEATKWYDGFLGVPVNMSAVGWIFTANDISGLPAPFRSRVKALEMQPPAVDHLRNLINGLRAAFAAEDGIDVRWLPSLDGAEMDAICASYAQHRSVRILKEQLRCVFDMRELRMQ